MKTGKTKAIPQNDSFDEDEKPDGWEQVNLSRISELIMGQSPPGSTYNTEGVGVPFFQGKADFTEKSPVVRVWCTQPKKFAKSGDILIAVRAPIGPTNVADRDCSIGRGLAAIRPKNGIPTEYILYYLKLKEPELALSGTGSTFTAIKKENLANLSIPLPPLAEQQRIVARVEVLLTHVNTTRDRLSRVPFIMKRFRQAVLAAACSGMLTEEWRGSYLEVESAERVLDRLRKGQKIKYFTKNYDPDFDSEFNLPINWCYVTLDRLIEFNRAIGYGVLKPGDYDPNGIRLIKSGQVRDGFMDLSETYRITPELDRQYTRTQLQGGEILLNLIGASIGRSAIASSELIGSNVSRAIAVIPVIKFFVKYVQLNLQGPLGQKLIQSKTGGSAQPVLNLEEVRSLLIPLPPLAEQHEIVRRVGALFERADAIDREVVAASRRCERLTQAVLGRAFTGKI